MKYSEAVNYLLEQLPMFQRVGAAAYRTDLTNIVKLCNILGNPQQNLRCIHVAGTNGKGSVTHIIASVLQQQGYKVGVFVSPHYKDYRERIKINGKYISKKFITAFVKENQHKFEHINASFFEISTVMAFEYFKKQKVDFAVIETGMGGRLDSTNIITPIVSVITNISYDHQQFLGNTLKKIATEKAGIIKYKVPVVIGETKKETANVFKKVAAVNKSPILFADKQKGSRVYKTDLQGIFQKQNVSTALCALRVLEKQDVKISESAIAIGLKNVQRNTSFIGRWMLIQRKPCIILDSAHNEGGIRELLKELSEQKYKTLHFVYGTVADKDITKVLKILPQKAVYYFCRANLPRALNAEELSVKASKYHLLGNSYSSVIHAFNDAKKNAKPNDLVLVAGSVFVVAEVI